MRFDSARPRNSSSTCAAIAEASNDSSSKRYPRDSILDSYVLLDNFQWGCESTDKPETKPVG